MIGFLKKYSFLLIILILNSCAVDMFFVNDNGDTWKKDGKSLRYGIYEKQFTIDVRVSQNRNEITTNGLTKYNAPSWIKDTIFTVDFIEKKLSFPDGIVLEKKSRPLSVSAKCYNNEGKEIPCLTYFYTCDDFKQKLRKNKHLNLKIVYDLDSLGVVTHHEKEYQLVKRRYCRAAVH